MQVFLFTTYLLSAQCSPTVPLYVIDLSSNPDTTWILYEEDALDRNGQCCSAGSNENCIQFQITLHPNTAGIFFDYDGAGAYGSLNWQIDCGPEFNLKDTICVTGGGTFTLTFCKPGSDNGNYTLISVPKPTFPENQFVPMNCEQPVEVLGVTENTISWQSISPGAPGTYNGMLSCTDCLDPVFTPDPNGPTEIEYEVCGYPILDYCVGNFVTCDTVKFTILDSIILNVSPSNPTFCTGGSVTLTANATGGDNNFTYYWYNSSLQLVGMGNTLDVSVAGTYSCEVRDGNYILGYCDGFLQSVTVVETSPPSVDAGADVVLCADDPSVDLSGTISFATGGIWSGGNGTYTPSNTNLQLNYTPTQAEIAIGFVTLTLTSVGAGGGCTNNFDEVQLFFIDTITTDISDQVLDCFGGNIAINPIVTGGLAPFQYSWTNGAATVDNTLNVGTHCLTITDANGCQVSECMTVTAPSELLLNVSSTPATSNGASDGTATVVPSGGTAPYTYSWSSGGINATETNLNYGIYIVTVTDANGCTRSASVVVNEPQCNGFSVNTAFSNVSCFGDSTGSASVEVVGGTAPFNFIWNDYASQTNDTASNLPSGAYEVIVIDLNGCVAVGTVSITEPQQLLNTITHTDVSYQFGNNGLAQANVTGGTGTYYYNWSNGDNAPLADSLSSNWYYVDITDDNGCQLIDSVFISEPPCNEFNIFVGTTSPLCNGALTGTATLTIVNGIAPYSIQWSTGEIDVTSISNLGGGIHTVEVYDAQGCYNFLNYGVSEPSDVSIALLPTASSCTNSNNGTIDMTISGGTYPYYSYAWSNGSFTEDLIDLAPGNYSVVVTDLNGCQETAFASLVDPTPLSISYSVQHVTCFGGTDGSINVTMTGGTGFYSYDWSNGATSEDLSGIDVGGYILNVTDGNGCDFDQPLTILVNEPELVIADSILTLCSVPGSGQTQIDVYPSGGNALYTISFDGGLTFGAPGNYSSLIANGQSYAITILDQNNCPSGMYNVDVDADLVIDSVTFNKCYILGQTMEDIEVHISGGEPNYAISTDGGNSFGTYNQLLASVMINNAYNVVAMDTNGCVSLPFAITLPDVFEVNSIVSSNFNGENISCFGSSDGAIDATVSGGTGPMTYTWSTVPGSAYSSNLEDPNGLAQGTYSVIVVDDFGCEAFDTISLVQPAQLTTVSNVTSNYNGQDVSCFGSNDGSAQTLPTGGVLPYSFAWSNGQSSQMATNLMATQYFVVITDVNGCTQNDSVSLSEPTALTFQSVVNDVLCNGVNDGEIDITIGGGTVPYSFAWSNGAITEDLDSLFVGDYSVVITDVNGCQISDTMTVAEPQVVALSSSITSVSCFNFNDGAIDITVTGGTLPYSYNWDNSQTTEDIVDLIAGFYEVIVTDSNGCFETLTLEVTQPDSLMLSGQTVNALCYGDANGSIDITLTGGTTPYNFTWSNGLSTEDISGLPLGNYSLEIEDANGCLQGGTFSISQPDSLMVTLSSPLNDHNHNIDLFGGEDGVIEAAIAGGTTPYFIDWSNGMSDSIIEGLSAGNYQILVTDMNGCVAVASIVLTEPMDLDLPTAFSPNADGYNDVYEIHGIEAYPDNTFKVFNRWGNLVYEVNAYNNTWYGESNFGGMLPDGVYFVLLEINGGEISESTYVHLKTH